MEGSFLLVQQENIEMHMGGGCEHERKRKEGGLITFLHFKK